MLSPIAHPPILLPRPHFARAVATVVRLSRAFVDAARALGARGTNRDAVEREALAELGEHMLKDIGASSWLAADAAARARDDVQIRVGGGLF